MTRPNHMLTNLEPRVLLSVPANDSIANAIVLPAIGGSDTVQIADATSETIPWDASAWPRPDVWYHWTPETSGPAQVRGYITVYTQADELYELAVPYSTSGLINFSVTAGQTYSVRLVGADFKIYRVDGEDGVPREPGQFSANRIGEQINLGWSDSSDNESGFRVWRNGEAIAELPAGTTSYSDTAFLLGRTVTYQVSAYNELGEQKTESNSLVTPPSNDDFADAMLLEGTSTSLACSFVDASYQAEEPPAAARTIWWKWTAPHSGRLEWSLRHHFGQAAVDVFQGNSLETLVELTSTEDTSGITVIAWETYYLRGSQSWDNDEYTLTLNLRDAAIPTAPTNISFRDTAATNVELSWTDNAVGDTGYVVEWYERATRRWIYNQRPVNATKASLTAGSLIEPILFRVRANGVDADSVWTYAAHQNVLPTPARFRATSVAAGQVTFTWDGLPYYNEIQLCIFRRPVGTETWSRVRVANPNPIFPASDQTPLPGVSYEYAATTYYVGTQSSSPYSNIVQVAAPPVISSIKAYSDRIEVNWTSQSASPSFELYRGMQEDGSDATLLASTLSLSYSDKTAKPGSTYYYRLYAIDGDLRVGPAVSPAARIPYPPVVVRGTSGDDRILIDVEQKTLTFNSVTREIGFEIDFYTPCTFTVYGGAGNDRIEVRGLLPYGSYQTYLYGGDGHDTLIGGRGADLIYGEAGNDRIENGDTLIGGAGNDRFLLAGASLALGEGGDDYFVYGPGAFTIAGGDGIDTLDASSRSSALILSLNGLRDDSGSANVLPGFEVIRGTRFGDDVCADGANNTIYGGEGKDSLFGGAGNDVIIGQGGDDTVRGGAGNDRLYGSIGNDSIFGGNGNDSLFGDAGADIIVGGDGVDRINVRDSAVDLITSEAHDILTADAVDLLA